MFLEPNQTPYDLYWRMLGTSVRVNPMFWLVSVIMGWDFVRLGLQYLAAWIACVFISILIHELGHVWMGQVFGTRGHIVLYGFGGLAIGSNQLYQRWQRIAVSFAGPAAGFLFLGLLFLVLWARDPSTMPAYLAMAKFDLGITPSDMDEVRLMTRQIMQNRLEFHIISSLIFINLLWGLVNLLPVWPLDGGQISRDFCTGIWPDRGVSRSLGISLVVAGLLAIHSLMADHGRPILPIGIGGTYSAILFGVLALQSFLLLQQSHQQKRWTDEHWDRNDWR